MASGISPAFPDLLEVEALDGVAAADALAGSLQRIMAAEADQVRLAAHWADLHAPEAVEGVLADLAPPAGGERWVRAGADGTPWVEEFASAELAVLLGLSTQGGAMLVGDAVNLRHRHPLLWARVGAGQVRVWVARKAARRCAAAGLTLEQARWVDEQTTLYAATLTPGRFLALVEAKVIAADPAAAAARAEAEAVRQFARAGQVDEHGMRTFVARAVAGDVTYLVAVLERIAGILALRGDDRPLEPRMATALRLLANPARALHLLTQTTLEAHEAADDTAGEAAGAADEAADGAAGAADEAADGAAGEAAGEAAGQPADAGPVEGGLGKDEPVNGGPVEGGLVEGVLSGQLPEGFGTYSEQRPELVGTDGELITWMRDTTGRRLPGTPLRGNLTPLNLPLDPPDPPGEPPRWPDLPDGRPDGPLGLSGGLPGGLPVEWCYPTLGTSRSTSPDDPHGPAGPFGPAGPIGPVGVEEGADPALLRDLLTALTETHLTRWDPVAVVHVHIAAETLTPTGAPALGAGAGDPHDVEGVVRVEDAGPATAAAVRAWLTDRPGPVIVRPTLDTRAVTAVDRYEFTPTMKDLIATRYPVAVFPYTALSSRHADHDHVTPYDPAGPPTQTTLANCAPLGRRHHRIKTHADWVLRTTAPGVYWWRTPHGHWYRVDHHGTHRYGRNPDLDGQLIDGGFELVGGR